MNRVAAHLIRMGGLLIEMIGVWAVFTDRGGTVSLPGGSAAPLAWLALGLGFVLWLAGTVLVMFLRAPRRKPQRIDGEITWSPADDRLSEPARVDDRSAR